MKNILLVEDEKFVRQGIRVMIERTGLCTGEIIECKNGNEALENLKKKKFDLILSDIKMPMMDGITFIEALRKEDLSDAFIVIISGYDDFSYAVQTMRLGACEYLLKPIEREAFVNMLEKIQQQLEQKQLEGVKPPEVPEDEEDKRQKIEKAVTYIKEKYNTDLNMAMVSNLVSMNYTFFSEAFKEITGKSFVDYLKTLRINVAKKLLRTTNIRISKLYSEVGYHDEKHFLKTFKAETGMTPTEYRQDQSAKKGNMQKE